MISTSTAAAPLLKAIAASVDAPRHIACLGTEIASIMYCAWVWISNFLRLVTFSLLLIPAFIPWVFKYFTDSRILHGIRFDEGRRRVLDIYMPAEAMAAKKGQGEPVPVVIAIMGGAWLVGYRAWNAQLGLRLMDAGVMVVAVDYRNYPFASVPGMLEDVEQGIAWVFANIEAYGGDPNNMVLTGQSAGAHLSSLVLLRQCLAEANMENKGASVSPRQVGDASPIGGVTPKGALGQVVPHGADSPNVAGEVTPKSVGCTPKSTTSTPSRGAPKGGDVAVQCQGTWSVSNLRGYVGISGAYDLEQLCARLTERGFSDGLLRSMSPGGDHAAWSTTQFLDSKEWRAMAHKAVPLLPPIRVYHGGKDKTVPAKVTEDFAAALQACNANDVIAEIIPELAHAEVVIEGPLRGEDHQVEWLLPLLLGDEAAARIDDLPALKPMLPRFVYDFASAIMPF